MKRYIFKRCDKHSERGFNVAIEVCQLIRGGFPRYVGGNYRINSASYKGDHAIAAGIISKKHGHKLDAGGYRLISKNIEIREF